MAAEASGIGVYASNNDVQFIGGGQLGYNYQSGPWVVGVEGSLSWASFDEVRRAAIPGGVLACSATPR